MIHPSIFPPVPFSLRPDGFAAVPEQDPACDLV
jgi:hypothetical protein